MLDARADFRFGIVGPPHRLRHSAAVWLLAMDMADEAILVQERLVGRRSVGGIGPHPARRIGLVEQALAQTTALEFIQPDGVRNAADRPDFKNRPLKAVSSPSAPDLLSILLSTVAAASCSFIPHRHCNEVKRIFSKFPAFVLSAIHCHNCAPLNLVRA
jgi:hypothetical protein